MRVKKIVSVVRQNNVWKEKISFCIIDTQSVKNADTDEEKGYDAGKKILGIKRHIARDIDVCYLFLSLGVLNSILLFLVCRDFLGIILLNSMILFFVTLLYIS
ncbi:hypothetical protein HGO53_05320 [Wolbachia endosymbiont of Diaphorina citri]|nr:hypothetical protein [Wolbachia endosymbiont of Diaphorina citri]QJT94655.1 hypothetical protein HGO48_04610 [Wolbachia endosymbiont of Diaphorina citri]QJT95894.1 hypothetical protein HGO49_04610 [Wolbachia endosymbiont of Diaphorina citri]QJT97256.1 hypothetical protein HGO53_05320 [Wolbachia endosymbiont of Diaphorina citri]QLK11552.1 hypothetical protein FK497_04670 [Wolbachia endosymbiont of Diaphorina citri]QXY86915.1 hypothetical protein GZ064_02935 [Wolbachia endosymbiont of Diaphor